MTWPDRLKNEDELGKWVFTVKEEGSFHESRHYNTKEEAEKAAQKYLKSKDGRYAFPETLEIKKTKDDEDKRKFRIIHSWVDMESSGLNTPNMRKGIPLESIIEGEGNSYKIVGYRQGSTFSEESLKHIAPNMKKYGITVLDDPNEEYPEFHATDDKYADILVNEYLRPDVRYELYQIGERIRPVKTDFSKTKVNAQFGQFG